MAPATVLLIDNDADSVTIYSLILEHHGYNVLHAFDRDTGVQLAVDSRPDVVISELFLPPFDGSTVVDRLRSDERTSSTPVIILDSIPSFGPELARPLEGLSRLTKPCEPSALLEEVQRLLSKDYSLPS